MDEIRLAIQSRHFKSMADTKGATALLEINADRERISIYGWDAYKDAELNGVPMGSLIVDAPAFKSVVAGWLAWMLGVDAQQIHELPKLLDELARYRAAYETLDEVFEDVPGYMGDESYGNELSQTLSACLHLARWKDIDLAEFHERLRPEADDDDEDNLQDDQGDEE